MSVTKKFRSSGRKITSFLRDKQLRTFLRLFWMYGSGPRYQPINAIKFDGLSLTVPDGPSAVWQFKEIFCDKIYDFKCLDSSPTVIDVGSNIGMSILYFLKRYPKARILGFEADPKVFSFLSTNIERNLPGCNVILENRAVWTHNNGVQFQSEGADGGSINHQATVTTPSIRLRSILQEHAHINMLKIDIEGAEVDVLADCDGYLSGVEHIFVEYHSWRHMPQELSRLLAVFEKNNFRYHIHSLANRARPLIEKSVGNGSMDIQLNIFAWNESYGNALSE